MSRKEKSGAMKNDKAEFDQNTIYMDGKFNFSYGEMLYGEFGFRNKAMYCHRCKKHFKYCECDDNRYR